MLRYFKVEPVLLELIRPFTAAWIYLPSLTLIFSIPHPSPSPFFTLPFSISHPPLLHSSSSPSPSLTLPFSIPYPPLLHSSPSPSLSRPSPEPHMDISSSIISNIGFLSEQEESQILNVFTFIFSNFFILETFLLLFLFVKQKI